MLQELKMTELLKGLRDKYAPLSGELHFTQKSHPEGKS